jgi:hypothetical protein
MISIGFTVFTFAISPVGGTAIVKMGHGIR